MKPRQTEHILIEHVTVGPRLRHAGNDGVDRLARSLSEIGLRTPITVRVVMQSDRDDGTGAADLILVTGATRLAAAKQLGWSTIEAFVVSDCDELDAELWEIAENLHRAGLTKDERDQQIRRYAELLVARSAHQSGQVVPIESRREDGRGHRPRGVASQVAEMTGLSKKTVARALDEKPKPKKEPLSAAEATEKQHARLVSAWNAAGPEARDLFIAGIDAPVMDRRFG